MKTDRLDERPFTPGATYVIPEPARLRRMRALSRLLDHSIPLPGGYRIGLDPLIGLIPAVGDFVAAMLSSYLLLEAYRLGIPKPILLRMVGNILIDALVGTVPVVGDLFDAVWKANLKNVELAEQYYDPNVPERSVGRLLGYFIAGIVALSLAIAGLAVLVIRGLLSLFS